MKKGVCAVVRVAKKGAGGKREEEKSDFEGGIGASVFRRLFGFFSFFPRDHSRRRRRRRSGRDSEIPMPPPPRHVLPLELSFLGCHPQASSRLPYRVASSLNRATRRSAETSNPRTDGLRRPPAAPRTPPRTPPSASPSASVDMNAAARAEAVSRLLLVEKSGVFVGALPWKEDDSEDASEGGDERRASSSSASPATSLTSAAMAATTDLVAGATRWRRALDAALSSLCGRSVDELDAPLRQVLRIALYELASKCRKEERRGGGGGSGSRRRLRRDPAAAAAGIVAAAVDLARSSGVGHAGSAKLTNAVLRKAAKAILEEGEEEEGEEEEGSGEKEGEESDEDICPVPLLPRSLLPPVPPPGAPERARLRSLAVSWSHPDWLVKRWVRRFGVEGAERLLAANNRRPRHALRAVVVSSSPSAGISSAGAGADADAGAGALPPALLLGRALDSLVDPEGGNDGGEGKSRRRLVEWRRSAVLPREFVVVERGMGAALSALVVVGRRPGPAPARSRSRSPAAAAVVVSAAVQDEASASVVALADPRPGERVLDVCAAPGGKTLFAAARMRRQGLLVARDSSAARLGPLREAAEAQGVRGPFLVVEEADGAGEQRQQERPRGGGESGAGPPPFDLVLVDAPCSGTGVLGKRADARWRKSESDLRSLSVLQDALLATASKSVRPGGGRLVYSTCSMEPEENAERVHAFLASEAGRGFELEKVDAAVLGLPSGMITAEGFLEALPHVHGTDGAFGARMVRRW